jgi:tetratricopeptide (TPR) repeat protein
MLDLAEAYKWLGRHREAITLCRQRLESRKARLGPDHPETLACLSVLAAAHQQAGEWDTSAQLWELLLQKRRDLGGPTDPRTMHELAITYSQMGRFAESITLHERALENLRSTAGPGGQIWCLMTFAHACMRAGQLDRAERLLREALENCRKQPSSFGVRVQTANAYGWLAQTLFLKKEHDAAEPLAREAVALWEKEQPDNERHFYWLSVLGDILCGRHRYAEAEPLLLRGYEGMKHQEAILPANEKRRMTEAGARIVHFYEVTNQPEKARAWREKLKANEPGAASTSVP